MQQINYDAIAKFNSDMMKLSGDDSSDVTINDINTALANWYGVGAYMNEVWRQAKAIVFELNLKFDFSYNKMYNAAVAALRIESRSTASPTQKAIDAKITTDNSEKIAKEKIEIEKAESDLKGIENLMKMHDKYISVLVTLSSNLRTEWVNANKGDSGHKSHKANRAESFTVGDAMEAFGDQK